ncbi:MAG: hypothetical protein M1830_005699 [Pleopsidium flavum]|nr:MAG: hypothetical protein M1830_005699 [Pleopsidium flavum]
MKTTLPTSTDLEVGPGSVVGFTVVRGWPSKGGIDVANNCHGVELDFLGLDRVKEGSRSEDPAVVEDIFCQRVRMISAKY